MVENTTTTDNSTNYTVTELMFVHFITEMLLTLTVQDWEMRVTQSLF